MRKKKRGMKWNSLYKFWTSVNAIWGTIWCLALAAVLALYFFGSGFLDPYMDMLDVIVPSSQILDTVSNLLIRLLASGLAMTILSYLAIPALNRHSRGGIVRIYLQSLMAALTHILKLVFFRDVILVVQSIAPDAVDEDAALGFYAVLFIMFFIRIIILLFNLVYFYKRKR